MFIFGCLIIRIGLVFLAKNISEQNLSYGIYGINPNLVFVIYLGDLTWTGGEVFGERIWWNDGDSTRYTILAFAYLAINKHKNAYKVLLADVTTLLSFLAYHFII